MTGAMKSRIQRTIPIWAAVLATSFAAAVGKTIYVDDDTGGANDGSSWTDAYTYLQDALGDTTSAEKPVEVLVAQGLYEPDQDKNQIPGDREASFQLVNGVTLLCGFAGSSEPDPDTRDIEAYPTILSWDLNRDDIEIGDTYELLAEPSRAENSYHVVTSSGTDGTSVLDGFTIISGNANGPKSDDPTDEKYRLMRGGRIYNVSGSPLVINCTFSENSSSWGSGMSNRTRSNSTLTNCTFSENKISWYGDGMINIDSSPTLTGCVLKENEARLGGGMRNSDSNPILINCLFADNVAYCSYGPYSWDTLDGRGGGIYSSNSIPALTNCTLSGNCAGDCAGGIYSVESIVMLTNCILWGNSLPQISGDATVSYSNIQGSWPGEDNLDADPLFVRSGYLESNGTQANVYDDFWIEGDYHLKSRNGRWDPISENWVIDMATSPCIDAGEPTSSIGFEPFPNGGIINMGAYGGTVEASMSSLTVGNISDPGLHTLEWRYVKDKGTHSGSDCGNF